MDDGPSQNNDETKPDESSSSVSEQKSEKENLTFDDPVIIRKTSPVLIGITIIITILLDGFTRTYLGLDLFNFLLLVIEFVINFIAILLENISTGFENISNVIKDNT